MMMGIYLIGIILSIQYQILPINYIPLALYKNTGRVNKQNLLSVTEVICQQSNPLPDADPQKIYATWLTTIFSLVCNNISIKLLKLLCSLIWFDSRDSM